MSYQRKRTRSSNFTQEEKKLLVDFVRDNLKIIENKNVDPTSVRHKHECWKRCAQKFQERGFKRDASKLKDTYHRMKHFAKVNIRKYKQHVKSVKAKNGALILDPPSDIDYAIMRMCPIDFQVDPDSSVIYSNDQDHKLTVIKGEPEFGDESPHTNPEVYMDKPELILENGAELIEGDALFHEHMDNYPDTIHQNCEPRNKSYARSEDALVKYYFLKYEHEMEIHTTRMKVLEADEKRKAELHEKALEEQNLKILLLKKQLNTF